jgi:thioredoxin 2
MIRACAACGQNNRIPESKLATDGRCGRCKAVLSAVNEPIDADEATFAAVTEGNSVPILVDFWAEWCGPCRMAAPVVKRVAERFAGRAIVLKVNTDLHPRLANRFDVSGIPNFVVLKDGQVVLQQPGLVSEQKLASWLEGAIRPAG